MLKGKGRGKREMGFGEEGTGERGGEDM